MAPKGGRGKGKGERKKKDEKVLPLALDVRVNLPDESHVVLKGISTDKIIDVRRLLCLNTVACNITNFSLSHEVKGSKLNESVDVAVLKPCTLTLVEEDYDEERAVEHVRRLLDLVSPTTCFGPPPPSPSPSPSPSDAASATEKDGKKSLSSADAEGNRKTPSEHQCQGPPKSHSSSLPAKDSSDDLEAEMSGVCPRLGAFYEFFSLADLTPPVQFIRRTTSLRKDECPSDDHLFFLEVKLCNGKLVIIEACARGFYSLGKHRVLCHNLVDLLRHLSRAFDNAYEDLMKAFIKRNKFGNLPYGFRANTWLVPPVASQSPSIFPSLPAEDETWGGNGGGCAWDGEGETMPWVNEFLFLKSMPCKTAEERQIRDRRAFLLHSLFVDVAMLRAIATMKQLMEKNHDKLSLGEDEILHFETVGDFSITVIKDASDASCKIDTKIDGSKTTGIDFQNLIQRNLLKGITADENTAAHDIVTLGVVIVRYCGYIAVVKVNYNEESEVNLPFQGVEIKDQTNGGANALNINSLRMLLHKSHTSREKRDQSSKQEELSAAQMFVEKLLKESLVKLEEEQAGSNAFMRWELGACWIQHLQDQNNGEEDKKQAGGKSEKQTGETTKNEMKVEGLGKPFKILKIPSKQPHPDEEKTSIVDKNLTTNTLDGKQNVSLPFSEPQKESREAEKASMLKDLLPEPAYTRLKESNVRLDMKSPQELTEMATRYYNDVALPKLVSDFGSLELSPVDGRTLTDFMHTRGLRMRSLGQVVNLSEKLSHVQSLCIHEMIVRSFKHIVRAVIAAVNETRDLSTSIAATLNLLLGIPDAGISHRSVHVHSLVWTWLTLFLKKRYDWELTISNYRDIRKYALLRGVCHKVGIELAPRDFDMDSASPFDKMDIISLVPVHKQVACSSADGRQLLESSKTALDKGKLEDAVNYGTKALAKLIAVCGPYHRMTAGAYSLLAVVLYHTGDFNQATTYQQKALDINAPSSWIPHRTRSESSDLRKPFYCLFKNPSCCFRPSPPNLAPAFAVVEKSSRTAVRVIFVLKAFGKDIRNHDVGVWIPDKEMSSDIRKWFMKQHDKGATASSKPAVANQKIPNSTNTEKPNQVQATQENSERRKTSKYFAPSSKEVNPQTIIKEEKVAAKTPSKRKPEKSSEDIAEDFKPTLPKRSKTVDDDNDDFMPSSNMKKSPKPDKKMKNSSVTEMSKSSHKIGDNLDDEINDKEPETPVKAGGRGKGGRGSGSMAAGRGRGAGRGGFMNFGERKDPPHKGEKEVPEGAPDCLAGLTFVLSGTLDSLEREEAEDLIKRHGGRITSAVSKKMSFLLADEDIGGRKSSKAKELGTPFLTEDGLFDMIRKSKPAKTPKKEEQNKKTSEKMHIPCITSSPSKVEKKNDQASALGRKEVAKCVKPCIYPDKRKTKSGDWSPLMWTEKYRPKVPADIIGNQSIVKQLQDWLMHWDDQFLHAGQKVKGKKLSDTGSKKAVLLSGSPGIGKSTSAKLVSQMLGFQAVEVNASDSRGKADTKIVKGVGGNTSNSIKELVSNVALSSALDWSKPPKSVLIMDEVDGMSAGDRGGVADLIASIKISKIPIICICNDRYSQKLKSLVNYCLALNFRKPTKQQMAKRLKQIADAEGLQINEISLEELAERVSGDMRMAINQLQYMSVSQSVINYDDIRQRLLSSAKDEDISPFTAVDKLFGFNGGKLRMDERIDLSMSDPDLVPLIVQENYVNYRPSSIGRDENGVKRMNLLALAAESIGDGDIFNVQIRRYRQWQLSQSSSFASCLIPAALMHGQRETLEPGERNFNRFGGWLGKNSTTGKNLRLLEDVHLHFLSSREARLDRETLRLEYFTLLLKQLTDPLRVMSKEVAVQKVVEFMDAYSLNQEDFDTIVELSKFKGHPNPMDDIQPAVKSALTRAYKNGSDSRTVRSADLIALPGLKKAPKKRIAAILEPVENGLAEENEEALAENGEENSDAEADDLAVSIETEHKPQFDLLSNKPKEMQVQLDLKSNGKKSNAKKTPASKSRSSGPAEKQAQGSGGRKRKR